MHPSARKLGFRPEDGAEFKKKAAAFFSANDFPGALDAAKLAVGCDPCEPDNWVLLAASHAKMGQLKAAIAALKSGIAIVDDHIPTWVALGEVFITGKNFPAAMKALQKAVELDKTGTHPGARRARMLLVARKQWPHGLPQ
jgi:tetratricopeptide (TPR) repeat protein